MSLQLTNSPTAVVTYPLRVAASSNPSLTLTSYYTPKQKDYSCAPGNADFVI